MLDEPAARKILPVSLVMGVIAGVLAGGFINVFNVPVMEWAISLEEAAAAAEAPDAAEPEAGGFYAFLGSLGMQRIGLVAGLAVLGVFFGAIFAGLFHLVRQAVPGWNIWAWAAIAGFLGFSAVSLFTQLKFPLNPPGIGEEGSLLSRQGFQLLFVVLSLALMVAGCIVIRALHQSGAEGGRRLLGYAGIAVAYLVVAVILFSIIPGNPDPVPEWVPSDLVIMFRTFTVAGHLLLWLTVALGVAGYVRYQERGIKASGTAAGVDRQASDARRG